MLSIDIHLEKLKSERGVIKTEYEFKLRKLNEAINALESLKQGYQSSKPVVRRKRKRKIAWKSEIVSLFNTRDTWSSGEIYDALVDKGFQIDSVSGRSAISTTLKRLWEGGDLERLKAGVYCRKETDDLNKTEGGPNEVDFYKGLDEEDKNTTG